MFFSSFPNFPLFYVCMLGMLCTNEVIAASSRSISWPRGRLVVEPLASSDRCLEDYLVRFVPMRHPNPQPLKSTIFSEACVLWSSILSYA